MCGLQQLQIPLIGKHVFILHQQTIRPQLGEQLYQLGKGKLKNLAVCSPCAGILLLEGLLSDPGGLGCINMALLRMRAPQGANATEIEKKIKRGNALRQGSAWRGFLGSRWFLVLLLVVVLMSGGRCGSTSLWTASRGELVSPHPRIYSVPCSEDYNNHKRYPGCTPQKCGRAVTDSIVTREEAETLKRLAERGLALAGSEGGASILDLHSGALSMGKQDVRGRIQAVIAETFGLDPALMFLTKPTFFSRINSTIAQTQHDEYWHPHIDKVTYGSFDYTSLLYLSDYGSDFSGGRFIFMDPNGNRTVEPRAGRVSFFSSGTENLHRVEKVSWGTRFAITVSFTCDPAHAIADPPCPKCGFWGGVGGHHSSVAPTNPAERRKKRKRDFTPAV
ncbi:hypothetical protein F7725_013853, partial [Dissostichus mawsoni]